MAGSFNTMLVAQNERMARCEIEVLSEHEKTEVAKVLLTHCITRSSLQLNVASLHCALREENIDAKIEQLDWKEVLSNLDYKLYAKTKRLAEGLLLVAKTKKKKTKKKKTKKGKILKVEELKSADGLVCKEAELVLVKVKSIYFFLQSLRDLCESNEAEDLTKEFIEDEMAEDGYEIEIDHFWIEAEKQDEEKQGLSCKSSEVN